MKILGTISYDGSAYYGFQIQTKQNYPTIQGEVEKYLSLVLNEPIKIFGSGRTDKGVHALNQTFHFETNKDNIDLLRLTYSLNKLLPNDILLKSLKVVDDDFHARYDVKEKHYQYRLCTKKNPFMVNYAGFFYKPLDLDLIKEGMKLFLGQHYFYNFCSNNDETTYLETIYDFTLKIEEDMLIFDIYGSGFKRYMVRMIIGTLVALGDHQIDLKYIEDRLNLPLGHNTSYNIESNGLYLMEVSYDKK